MRQTKILAISLLLTLLVSFSMSPKEVSADPPQCFNFDGTSSRDCQDGFGNLADDKCYTEIRSGPNGTLTGYSETSCKDSTDRDQDGVGLSTKSNFEGDCKDSLEAKDCGVTSYILLFTNALSAIVGIVIVIMIVVGGIQYAAAQDNPQAVQAARQRIINALIALLLYLFLFAFLQYIVPGGIL